MCHSARLITARRSETRPFRHTHNRERPRSTDSIAIAAATRTDDLSGTPGIIVEPYNAKTHTGTEVELVR